MHNRVTRVLVMVGALLAAIAPAAHAGKSYKSLVRAVEKGNDKKIDRILTKHPERVHEALLACAAGDDVELANQLLARGASLQRAGLSGENPLLVAADSGSPAMIELLLQRGADTGYAQPARYLADVKEEDEHWVYEVVVVDKGHDALTRAIAKGRADVVQLLLDQGSDPNRCFVAEDAASGTGVDLFRFADSPQGLTFPMKNDVWARMDKTERDNVVRFRSTARPTGAVVATPLELARKAGNARVVELLENAGARVDAECDPSLAAAVEENQKYR